MGVPIRFDLYCHRWHSLNLTMSLLFLLSLSSSSHAGRQISTLNLASMRIATAKSQLKEAAGSTKLTVLQEICGGELAGLQDGLTSSQAKVISDPDDARRDLVAVESNIEACIAAMGKDQSSTGAYALLTKVEQSVVSAENLIDQSVTKPEQDLTQEVLDEDGGMQEPDSETGEAMADVGSDSSPPQLLSTDGGPIEGQESSPSGPFQGTLNLHPLAPTVNMFMEEMQVDYCPGHVLLQGSSAIIRLDSECGGKFHTHKKYSSGVFSVRMRAPSNAPGVSNSFYISSNDEDGADMISFDLIGNLPNRVLTGYAVNGVHSGTLETFHMDFDTSLHFHEYTIKWDKESVVWMVDSTVIRTLRSSRVHAFPSKSGHVYGYSWDATYVAEGGWAGKTDWDAGPFLMHYNDLQITSPLSPGQWRAPPQLPIRRDVPLPVHPVVIDYCASNIGIRQDASMTIAFDKLGCGGRIRSLKPYSSGRFTGNIKCPDGDTSGLLTSLYVSSGEGSRNQDEIDFEFLGDNKRIVQTNFYVNGTGGNEHWVELDFDCSHRFHTYSIHYNKQKIQWFIDSKLVRTVLRDQQIAKGKPYPVKNVFLYASVWNASSVNDGLWTGKWHGSGLPFVAKFKDVTVQFP